MQDLKNFITEVINNPNITVVKFFATWCGPCQMLAPVMERVIEANPDIKFFKVDVDENKDLVHQLGLKSVPAVFVYKNGKQVGSILGLKLQADYQELINRAKL